MKATSRVAVAVVTSLVFSTVVYGGASSSPERITEGVTTPEFSTVDMTGQSFVYTPSGGKALILAFLSSQKKGSQEAMEDILKALSGVRPDKLPSLQVVFVMEDVGNREFMASIQKNAPCVVHVLDDDQRTIWNKFGVIATPTVLMSDPHGKVVFVRPGPAQKIGSEITAQLSQILSQRRIAEGAMTPGFSAVDLTGKPFAYAPSGGKALILAFLSSQQESSQRTIEDVLRVLSGLPTDKLPSLQVAFVMENVDNGELLASIREDAPSVVQIVHDEQYAIWGRFGVIALPTVLISNPQGKVLCVKPGHSYDVAPVIKSRIFEALDIPYDVSPREASIVQTAAHDTISAKAKRHLAMARALLGQGRVRSAYKEAQMAHEMDPNSTDVALALGEFLCQAAQAQEAGKTVGATYSQSNRDKARINLALGWVNLRLGKLEEAEKFLKEGISQDPACPRLHFELGRIYQKRNDSEKAMQAYLEALQLIYREK